MVGVFGVLGDSRSAPSPERLVELLSERGYPTKYVDRQFDVPGMGRVAVKELRVYNHGVTPGSFTALERIGGIFYVSSDYSDEQAAKIAQALEGRFQRASRVIYMSPYKEGQAQDTSVSDWVRSFN